MDKTVKDKWVAALRSGKYQQGKYALRKRYTPESHGASFEQFCCLGVLCDLVQPEGWEAISHPDEDGDKVYHENKDNLPSTAIQMLVGLSERTCEDLAAMNDEDANFESIAAFIEESL